MKRTILNSGRLIAVWLAVSGLTASEYRGTIQSGALPVPGAAVTATQAGKQVLTTTDERGVFRFADLADGAWTIQVEMTGFATLSQRVVVAAATPAAAWQLKLLSQEALQASLAPAPEAKPATAATPAAAGQPAGAAAVAPAAQTATATPEKTAAPAAPARAATAKRPAAAARGGYRRVDVNQSTDSRNLSSDSGIKAEEVADLSQRSANSFIVQGSMSSAAGLEMQNDWRLGGGPGAGMDPMVMGLNGPAGGPGMAGGAGGIGTGGPGGDGPGPQGGGMRAAGGAGGMGGPDGGGPGGGGPGGGGPGGGGPGGGMGGMGMGGPPPGGRPDWQGRMNARSFGNNRRDPRSMYNGNIMLSFNNSLFDARTFSVTGATVDKPSYGSLRGGLMFGGPLRIPKLVAAERRIFFSLNYQFSHARTGTVSQAQNMPAALERSGDFSQSTVSSAAVAIYDPTTGSPFPGNKIPSSRISSTATSLLNYYPLPNLTDSSRNYQTSWSGKNNSDNVNSRLSNIKFTSKDRLEGSVGYQKRDSSTPNVFKFVDSGSGSGINASLGYTHNFATRVINSLRYTFSRNRDETSPYFAYRENVASTLGILGTSQNPMNWGPPNLSFTNYAGLADGNSSLSRNQTGSVTESLLWVRGSHTLTFGGEYRRQQFNSFADSNGRGSYAFTGSATGLSVDGAAQSGTGYDLADFLLGLPTTSSIRYGNPDKYFRGSNYSVHVNDDWRITTKFTLVTGLRWDYATPVTEIYNRLVNLSVGSGFATATAVKAGGTMGNALINSDRNNFSPRLGFAWRPQTNGSLVVRGGYGIYYNTSVYNTVASNMAQQPPFAETLSVTTSAANPLTLQTGFLQASSTSASSTFAIDPNYRIGYAQTWNLTVQKNLFGGMYGTAGYLGTKGTRLDQQFIPNSVAPGATESALPHNYTYETSNGNSIYHAAQFQLNRRFRSGIMANSSYQFSKSIDNAGTGGRGEGNTPVAQNWLDLAAERGLSGFDSRHNFSTSFQYSSGMGASGGTLVNGWKGAFLKDWTFGGNVNLRSGTPLTATVGGSSSQVSGTAVSNTVRANSTGASVSASGLLFNTAAFTAPASGSWGNAGRNTIPGPVTFYLNGSFGRVFRIGERRNIDLQMQAQNILNRVTITSWGTTVGSTNYGLATNAAAMRKITFSLRFRF